MGGGGDCSATSARRDWVFLASFHCVFTFIQAARLATRLQHTAPSETAGEWGAGGHFPQGTHAGTAELMGRRAAPARGNVSDPAYTQHHLSHMEGNPFSLSFLREAGHLLGTAGHFGQPWEGLIFYHTQQWYLQIISHCLYPLSAAACSLTHAPITGKHKTWQAVQTSCSCSKGRRTNP